jgi:RNA polymerase sigma-70 factor (TIGR02957 family)
MSSMFRADETNSLARLSDNGEDRDMSAGATDTFVAHRNLLFTVAYEMIGSAADAEDVLQETWLRWAQVDHEEVRDPRAFLVRITTRLALNRLRTVQRQRETYVGPWLPEPLLTTPDVAEDVELADSVSFAMLTVLETLLPAERAVFVLREVFDLPYDDIAAALDRSSAAVRQLAHRARSHVDARQPRIEVSFRERDAVVHRFLEVVHTGDFESLMDVLAPDVVLVTDGGGKTRAALRPILGRDKVLRFMRGVAEPLVDAELRTVNGAAALCLVGPGADGEVHTIVNFLVEDGLVTGLYVVRNPDKLGRLEEPVTLAR